jgi:hypothetical protein
VQVASEELLGKQDHECNLQVYFKHTNLRHFKLPNKKYFYNSHALVYHLPRMLNMFLALVLSSVGVNTQVN